MSDRLTPERETEIRARLAAATPGPWRAGACVPHAVFVGDASAPRHIMAAGPTAVGTPADARFIAGARSDVNLLLTELAAVRAERDALAAELGKWMTSGEIEAEAVQGQGAWGAGRAAAIRRDLARADGVLTGDTAASAAGALRAAAGGSHAE